MKLPRMGKSSRQWMLGMDIDRDVTITQVAPTGRQGSEFELRAMAVIPSLFSPSTNGVDDESHEEERKRHLQEVLRNIVTANGWRGFDMAISLPPEHIILRHVTLPPMQKKALQHAIKVELESNVHLPFDDPLYDYVVQEPRLGVNKKDAEQDVIVIAAPRHEIEPWVQSVRKAGLRPVLVQPGVLGARRLVTLHNRLVGHYAVITLGYNGMEFGVFKQDNLIFVRHVGISPANYTYSDQNHPTEGDGLYDRRRYMTDIGYEVQRSLNFVQYNLLRDEDKLSGVYVVPRIPDLSEAIHAMATDLDQRMECIDQPFAISGRVMEYVQSLAEVYDTSISLANVSLGLALLGGDL